MNTLALNPKTQINTYPKALLKNQRFEDFEFQRHDKKNLQQPLDHPLFPF